MLEKILFVFWPAVLVLAVAGWGSCWGAIFFRKHQTHRAYDALTSAYFGIFFITFGALVLNFWRGLGETPGLWVVGLGVIFFSIQATRSQQWRKQALFILVVTSAFALFFRELRFGYDAGLYHIPYMNWVANGPIPLGLANLEGRLGFNSTWLLFVSAIRIDSISAWSHLIHAEIAIRALTIGWLAWRFYEELCYGWTRRTLLFGISTTVVSAYLLVLGWSTSTDQAANLCAFVTWVSFSDFLLGRGRDPHREAVFTLLLATMAVTIKISMLPIMLLPIYLMLNEVWLTKATLQARTLAWTGAAAMFAVAWMFRNVLLSGCFVFPAAGTCITTSWSAPLNEVERMSSVIMAVARIPSPSYQSAMAFWNTDWLPTWIGAVSRTIPFLSVFFAALFAIVLQFLCSRRGPKGENPSQTSSGWLALTTATVAAGILLWFIKAPGPRFSWVFFSILCTTIILRAISSRNVALPRFNREQDTRERRLAMLALPVYVLVMALTMNAWTPTALPTVKVEQMKSDNGWTAWRPVMGDQCWTNFPCSPYTTEYLDVYEIDGRLVFKPGDKKRIL